MLLGRPWLREAKVKHDWYKDMISFKKRKKNKYIEFGIKQGTIKPVHASIYAETLNVVKGLEDEEEEQLLRDNQDLIPFSILHVDKLIKNQQDDATLKAPDLRTILKTPVLQREKDQ